MVSYLQAQNLTRSVGDKTLFRDLCFSIGEGQKVGLIAKNGTGKSTLLNILAGKDQADEGQVVFHNDLRIGYLEQTPNYPLDLTV
ncbi:MAG: ABC-F family ATP-binding cassette domain-containing protein, partial [Bacteroidaceae bacterium]|nr:ABC-F family ATP-binding cassette domain-containing protein [Bacteroidaceae bacterium]